MEPACTRVPFRMGTPLTLRGFISTTEHPVQSRHSLPQKLGFPSAFRLFLLVANQLELNPSHPVHAFRLRRIQLIQRNLPTSPIHHHKCRPRQRVVMNLLRRPPVPKHERHRILIRKHRRRTPRSRNTWSGLIGSRALIRNWILSAWPLSLIRISSLIYISGARITDARITDARIARARVTLITDTQPITTRVIRRAPLIRKPVDIPVSEHSRISPAAIDRKDKRNPAPISPISTSAIAVPGRSPR